MRLSAAQVEAIKQETGHFFGAKAEVRLFGSHVDEWLELREMRNAFAHDYPGDSELQAAILNRAFAAADRLIEILHHVRGFSVRYENK